MIHILALGTLAVERDHAAESYKDTNFFKIYKTLRGSYDSK